MAPARKLRPKTRVRVKRGFYAGKCGFVDQCKKSSPEDKSATAYLILDEPIEFIGRVVLCEPRNLEIL